MTRTTSPSRTPRPAGRGGRRALLALAAVAASLLTVVPPAQGAPRTAAPAAPAAALPAGWAAADDGLTWTSPVPVPMGGARLEVYADGEALGVATVSADRRTVHVAADPAAVRDLSTLAVVAAGRRLDAGETSLAAAAATTRSALTPQAAPKAAKAAPAAAALPALPALPASADPGRRGPYDTRTGEYSLPGVRTTDLPVKVEMDAVVVSPVGAEGKRPVALFLHGRHEPCYYPAGEPTEFPEEFWPCPAGWKPVPSYRGYLQSQELLASQGWITVSVSANGINAQDFAAEDGGALARSELVRAHLARWAAWAASDGAWASAPKAVRKGPRPDLDRLLLVGHSRGGEGVNRAAMDSALDPDARWTVRGQLLLAPTAFGRNPTPGVPTAVVLPYCDGDVFDLQGQGYLDDARDLVSNDRALRGAVMVLGANHNFFNTEWTPGISEAPSIDDWFDDTDPTCGASAPGRLTAKQQRAVGATYVAAAAQALVLRDRRVVPLLDGSPVRARSAGAAVVRSHALGAGRVPFLVPGSERTVTDTGATTARTCTTEIVGDPAGACLVDDTLFGAAPHFPNDFFGFIGAPARDAVEVRWATASGSARVGLARSVDVDDRDDLALRVVVPPRSGTTRFAVRLRDRDGSVARLGEVSLKGLPGGRQDTDPDTFDPMPGKYWAQEVRVRLDRAVAAKAGLDLARVTGIDLVPVSRKGHVWLLDAWARDPGLARDRAVPFVRVDVGTLEVDEGDSGTRRVRLPLTVEGALDRPAKVWIGGLDAFGGELPPGLPRVVTVPPGARSLDVTTSFEANTLDDEDVRGVTLFARGVRSAVPGDWVGGLLIRDDDPSPAVTVTPAATAVEGSPLRWTISLAAPSGRFIGVTLFAVPPASGTQLSTDDVPADWFLENFGFDPPSPPLPLSDVGVLFAQLAPGETSVTVELPTLADGVAEGTEVVALQIPAGDPSIGDPGVPGLPAGALLTGTVTE